MENENKIWQHCDAARLRDSCEIPQENLNSDSCHQPRSPPPISNPATLIQDGDASSRPHARMACSKLFTTITIDYCKQKQCDPKLAKQTKTQVQLETHALTQVTHRSYLSREKERKNSEMIKQFCWIMLCHRERRWRRRVVYKQTHKIGERVKEIQNPHKQI